MAARITWTLSRLLEIKNMNDWSKLLLAFLHGKFPQYDYGLTLRFIVGACQIPIGTKFESPEDAKLATQQIYDEMTQYDVDGHVVTSNDCGIHNGKVLRLENLDLNDSRIGVKFDELWARYGSDIISGEYHIDAVTERPTLLEIFPEQ